MEKSDALELLSRFSNFELDKGRFEFSSFGENLIYGEKIVASDAEASAARWAGIPVKFLPKCPVDLRVSLLNRFFKEYSGYPDVLSRKEIIHSFVDPSMPLLLPHRVLNTIEQSIPNLDIDRIYTIDNKIEVYTVGPKEHAVEVGDLVKGGIWVSFSPFGENHPEVAGYTYRLVCSNGMVRPQEHSRFSYSRDGDPYEWIGISANKAYDHMENEVIRYRNMKSEKLNGNMSSVVNHVARDLPSGLREALKDYLMNRNIEDMYDLMCGITEFASHHLNSPKDIWRVMSAGGNTVDHMDVCDHCRQIIQ